MLRAAAWTGGLFAVGCGVVQMFPGQFTEPLVLIVLGAMLVLVAGRSRDAARQVETASDADTVSPTRAVR
jgi:hypothetical protein